MATDPLQPVLDAIAGRRLTVSDLGAELRRRIDELGAVDLSSQGRQDAFSEVLAAITPPGFDVFPMPDQCRVDPADHSIVIFDVVVDQAHRQVVGVIHRKLMLDTASVKHELLEVQKPYRGGGLATLLLDRSFRFYDTIGVRNVHVHAALETGRWYWARLGFEFATLRDQANVATWGLVCLEALGELPLPPDSPARRWAHIGTGAPEVKISLEKLHAKLQAWTTAGLADPNRQAMVRGLEQHYDRLLDAPWLDHARIVAVADANEIAMAAPIPLGRAIMLTGPDWHGVFDLRHQGARDAFAEELNRALKKAAQPP